MIACRGHTLGDVGQLASGKFKHGRWLDVGHVAHACAGGMNGVLKKASRSRGLRTVTSWTCATR
jgi:hypothetical protein